LNFLNKFSKNSKINNLFKIRPLEAVLFHVDGQTYRHDEANSGRLQFCESAKKFMSCRERNPGLAAPSVEDNEEVRFSAPAVCPGSRTANGALRHFAVGVLYFQNMTGFHFACHYNRMPSPAFIFAKLTPDP